MIQLFFILFCLAKADSYVDVNCNSAYCSDCGDDSSNPCYSCIDGYIINGGKCVWRETIHCTTSYDGVCNSCESGYVLNSNYECIECSNLENCVQLDGETCSTGCELCAGAVYLNTETKKMYYNNDKECTHCIDLYYLDGKKKCQKGSIDNCIIYSEETVCSMCAALLTFDKTSKKCVKCAIDNCKQCSYSDSSICSFCESGYYSSNNKCSKLTTVEHCSTYSVSEDKCSTCEDGYRVIASDNTCEQCAVDNCMSCLTNPGYCSTCATGYQRNGTDYTCVELPAHCVSFISDPTNCEECEDGYFNNEGVCEKCSVDGCNDCSDNKEKCRLCQDGYYITEESICGKCADECVESVLHNQLTCTYSSYTCYVNPITNDWCKRYNSNGSKCIECDSDFGTTLDDGKCYEYTKITGYDDVAYGCIEYKIDKVNEMLTDVELYKPEDGVCENPYLNNGFGIMVVGICLAAILLL
ncbi:Furin repeat-containing protein [Entamoeba marina]